MPPLSDIRGPLSALLIEPSADVSPRRGRPPRNKVKAMTNRERLTRSRAGKKEMRLRNIAILDFETDPFDGETQEEIFPFVFELYSDQFGSIVVWEETFEKLIDRLIEEINSLPGEYTIYAHNGGKFDFLFLVHKLRGVVKFKGRAIMSARIGKHELRDSLHILPEKLAAWKKDTFDYEKMRRGNRNRHRQEILTYLHSDCIYLFDIVKSFITEFGLKLSIGQAAFSELKKSYTVASLSEQSDAFLRRYFFGGRVECIRGRGLFDTGEGQQDFKLFDVNSMYPDRMANCAHPVGREYNWRRGNISPDTVFVDVECRSRGAFVSRAADSPLDAAVGKSARQRYYVTRHEFDVASKYGLISDVDIVGVVDNIEQSNFSRFIVPMYDRRRAVKRGMANIAATARPGTKDYEEFPEYQELKKQDLFLKYLLNNAYGKFAQNPRNFKEFYYTDPGEQPPDEWMKTIWRADEDTRHKFSMPVHRHDDFHVWAKPSPGRRYNNVGTAASITGAARAKLLEAIQHADTPIYCDTDSLICRNLGTADVDVARLGAWKLETVFDRVIIAGRKLYACEIKGLPDGHEKRVKIRSKGATGLIWSDLEKMLEGETIRTVNKAPTISKIGVQEYLKRNIRATAPLMEIA